MIVFYAVSNNIAYMGSFGSCRSWAWARILSKEARVVKILKARPDAENARIVFEVNRDGEYACRAGRRINLRILKKLERDDGAKKSR